MSFFHRTLHKLYVKFEQLKNRGKYEPDEYIKVHNSFHREVVDRADKLAQEMTVVNNLTQKRGELETALSSYRGILQQIIDALQQGRDSILEENSADFKKRMLRIRQLIDALAMKIESCHTLLKSIDSEHRLIQAEEEQIEA